MSKKFKIWIISLSSILFLCAIALCIAIPINITKIKITATFDDLELYTKRLPVYYKGFKLGRVIKVYLSEDSKTTNIDMRLKLRGAKLPNNVIAKIKNKKKKDFIEIEYPKIPSGTYLKNGDIIEGHNSFDLSSYIDKQADSGGLDEIKTNLNSTIVAAGETLNALTGLIMTGDDILKDIRPDLKESSKNLAKTTRNLEDVTAQLSKSTRSKRIKNSGFNIEQSTKNIEIATKNLEAASENLSLLTEQARKNTITLIDSTISNVNKASFNLNTITEQIKCILLDAEHIVKGIKITLSQKFSGIKIMFGKAIQ